MAKHSQRRSPFLPGNQEPATGSRGAVVFNARDLLRRLMGDRQLAGIVVHGFLEDAPRQLSRLRQRLDENDVRGFGSLAHALRGASATVGAEGLSAVAEAMEAAGREGQLRRCGELLPRAVDEFERYACALKRSGWLMNSEDEPRTANKDDEP